MITRNITHKLPRKALWYLLVYRSIVAVIFVGFGVILLVSGTIVGTVTVNGVTSPSSFSPVIPALALIVIGLIGPIYSILWYFLFSYIVSDQNITINSGILFRQSRSIDFNKIQDVTNIRGPLQMMFGLTTINLWTASQDQISFNTVTVGGVPRTQAVPKPDGQLVLLAEDADELRTLAMSRGNIQNVRVVPPGASQ